MLNKTDNPLPSAAEWTIPAIAPRRLTREGCKVPDFNFDEGLFVSDGLRRKLLLDLEHANRLLDSGLEIDAFLQLIVDIASENAAADYAGISIRDEISLTWLVKAEKGALPAMTRGICQQILATDSYNLLREARTNYPCLDRLNVDDVTVSLMCVPLTVDEKIVGGITLVRVGEMAQFSAGDMILSAILGQWCSLKLANIGLIDDLALRTEHERKLLSEVCRSQEEERRRLAADLHDGIAQWMVGASYDIGMCQTLLAGGKANPSELAESLQRARETMQKCIVELRRAIANIRPLPIAELGLVGALNQAALALGKDGIECRVNLKAKMPKLTLAEENTVFWIVQETLNNVRKHSQAKTAAVEIVPQDGTLLIRIADNGCGFTKEQLAGTVPLQRMGFIGMKERAELLGGSLEIESRPGFGTTVLLSFRALSCLSFKREHAEGGSDG
jgi:two-component system, NarL family, sensor kinase